jgi:phage shock protein E
MKTVHRRSAFARAACVALLIGSAAVAADLPTITPMALNERLAKHDASVIVVDVRTPEEFARAHVPGAINIPYDTLAARKDELTDAKNKDVVLYCRTGRRSKIAANTLEASGFDRLLQLEGNIQGWADAKLPVDK